MRSAASRSVSREAVPLPMAMRSTECSLARRGQRGERAVPLVLRDVRVDDLGRDDASRPVDDRDLDAGAEARVEAHRGACAGGGSEQQVAQVGGEHAYGLLLGRSAQLHTGVDAEVDEDLRAPGPAHGVGQPLVGAAPGVLDAEAARDGAFVCRGAGLLLGRRVVGDDLEREDVLLLSPEEGEDAVGRQLGEGLGEVEVVGELRALLLLAGAHAGADVPVLPDALTEVADEVGVLGEALDENGAGTIERGRGVRDLAVGIDESCCGR